MASRRRAQPVALRHPLRNSLGLCENRETGVDGERRWKRRAVGYVQSWVVEHLAIGGVRGSRLATTLDELERSQWLTAEPRGYAFVARIFGDVLAHDQVEDGERLRILERCGRS